MSKPLTIVVAATEHELEGVVSIRDALRDGIGPAQTRPVRCHFIKDLQVDRLRAHLRRVKADVAVCLFEPAGRSLDEDSLAAVKGACLECPVLAVVPEMPPEQFLALLEAGASDFAVAPVRAADFLPRLGRLLQLRQPESVLVDRLKQVVGSCQILGQSPSLLSQLGKLPLLAGCDATVLILGETGTGKELFARATHYLSRRSAGPFVAINCGAIPAELAENELFGHEAGAYTTANTMQTGLLRQASEGSLFLDEIDTLSLALQVKLLRFLQDKEYRPLGSGKTLRADVRLIAASNVSLEAAMRAGRFRQDLYYRLSVLSINLPPLRERREDIPLLARHFLARFAAEFKRPPKEFTPGAIQTLQAYGWPGNVRELENVVQRAVLLGETTAIDGRQLDLPASPTDPGGTSFKRLKAHAVHEFEHQYLTELLEKHADNISAAARDAGKNRRAFWELLRKHQLLPPPQSASASARVKPHSPRPASPS